MSDEQVLEILVDFANAIEAAAVNVKHKVSEIMGVQEEEEPYDPSKIRWTETQGPHGTYERAAASSNPDFQALLKSLKAHEGKLTKDGFFYWQFKNGNVIGRKKRK